MYIAYELENGTFLPESNAASHSAEGARTRSIRSQSQGMADTIGLPIEPTTEKRGQHIC